MARRRKGGSTGNGILGAVIIGAIALAAIPKEFWVGIGVIGAIVFVAYLFKSTKKAAPGAEDGLAGPSITLTVESRISRSSDDDQPISVWEGSEASSRFRIPPAPNDFKKDVARWIPAGESINVAGINIPGGMLYVGSALRTPYGTNDPCLIDPSKSLANNGDFTERDMGYWPSYSEISPTARRAYLHWLVEGRSHPEADIGYVFIFYYGLERRVLVDAPEKPEAKSDLPLIAAEIRRLIGIYGESSHSFRRYANGLLDWISLSQQSPRLYEQPVPDYSRAMELPTYVRLALGQAAIDRVAVPVDLALAWVKLDPSIFLRTPAKRCVEQFDLLFREKYSEVFGAGLVLPRNRTKLKFVYQPASSGFRGRGELKQTFGDIPDVTVLTGPLKKIQQVVYAATTELEAYSRYLGRNPNDKTALEGLLQLPATLWPESAQAILFSLKNRMGNGMLVLSFQELLASLEAKSALTKSKMLALASALESLNIGIEPDVLGGAKLPKPEEKIVLFAIPPGEKSSRQTPAYQAAALTLQLASAVAIADGEFNPKEIAHLSKHVQSWTHLAPNHIRRLLAHLRLLVTAPKSLASLKAKLDPLESAAKETIAAFMATVAQADGIVSPDEVKMLEKIYRALGIDAKKVFSNVHAVTTASEVEITTSPTNVTKGFVLDHARIAALQQDTDKVTALLAGIFKEEEALPELAQASMPEDSDEDERNLLGLDGTHTALVRMLLSRPYWSREELSDVAADLDVMLDGALERINEAAFDAYDIPLTEGEDPIEINAEIIEKVEA